jgi:hypothetical protein
MRINLWGGTLAFNRVFFEHWLEYATNPRQNIESGLPHEFGSVSREVIPSAIGRALLLLFAHDETGSRLDS